MYINIELNKWDVKKLEEAGVTFFPHKETTYYNHIRSHDDRNGEVFVEESRKSYSIELPNEDTDLTWWLSDVLDLTDNQHLYVPMGKWKDSEATIWDNDIYKED